MRLHEKQALSEKATCLARQQDEAGLKSLLAEHPDVLHWTHLWGETPLHYCVVENDLEAVRLLVRLGADIGAVNDSDCPPLVTCCGMQYQEMARYLLDCGADPDSKDQQDNAIVHAIEKGDVSMVKLLLEYGANPNVQDYCGTWAIFEAFYKDHGDIARLLLDHGADATVEDDEGDTLHQVIYTDMDVDAIAYYKLLREYRVDLLRVGSNGKHPIFSAIIEGDRDVARYFLELGMDKQVRDKDGDSIAEVLRMAGMNELI
jgi:ankyrin repeat protein